VTDLAKELQQFSLIETVSGDHLANEFPHVRACRVIGVAALGLAPRRIGGLCDRPRACGERENK
jgi:hypothetical protein